MSEIVDVIDLRGESDVVRARVRASAIARAYGVRRVDETRFSTAISELARNAIEHADGGRIVFSLDRQAAQLVVRVSDTGTGIRPEVGASRVGIKAGLGKGLSGARRLVDEMTIDSSSEGTTVTVKKNVSSKFRAERPPKDGGPKTGDGPSRAQERDLLLALEGHADAEALARVREDRLRLAVETAELGICEYTPETKTVSCDARTRALLGVPEHLDEHRWLEAIHEDDRGDAARLFEEGPAEFELRTAPPNERWVMARARTIGPPALRVIALFDTTEKNLRTRELAERLEVEQQLIGIVSHDLRSPLNSMMIAVELLAAHGVPHQKTVLDRAASSVTRMTDLIEDLLDFTRARLGGGIPIVPTPTDLEGIALQVADLSSNARGQPRVTVRSSGDCHGYWDAARLTQVLVNVVDNALTYSPPDCVVEIVVDGERADEVVVVVSNFGDTIPEHVLATLFEPFVRGTEGGQSSSLGLGTFIVKTIVEAHGGTVDVRSTAEDGTRFRIVLPRGDAPE